MIDAFLAGRSDRTRQAYQADLDRFARFVGKSVEAAVERLLESETAAARLMLAYAADLRRRGSAPSTIRRRLSTLHALVQVAQVEWSLQLPSEEDVERAMREKEDGAPYLLPRVPAEIDRLDVQHYAYRAAANGANYFAPIRGPRRILDVGAGTGQWGFELCAQFPDAEVVGLDLVPSKPDRPANYRYVEADLLEGLPFEDDTFDFVHQRLLVVAIPLEHWPAVVVELVRVTRPGGWVELVESEVTNPQGGPVLRRLAELTAPLFAQRGLAAGDVILRSIDDWLREAGLMGVYRREAQVPVGEWGGRLGSLLASDARSAYTQILGLLPVSAGERAELLTGMLREFEEYRVAGTIAFAFGQKPLR